MHSSVWILGDQLLTNHPALAAAEAEAGRENLKVVLVESLGRASRLAYQKKKLVLLFSALRHFAAFLREQGYAVEVIQAESMLDGLRQHFEGWQPARWYGMAASEYGGRRFQANLGKRLGIDGTILPNTQFLTGRFDPVPQAAVGKKVVMETFYRAMRRHFHFLLEADGTPVGGSWNFDRQNRQRLPGGVELPGRLKFEPDDLTHQVMQEVEQRDGGVGSVQGFDLAVTHAQAEQALADFLDRRLADFGPYEDAMSSRSGLLFHSMLSPYLNIGLLEPLQTARRAEERYLQGLAPLPSVEGFIRQVVGWREFIYWQYWRQMPGLKQANFWGAIRPLPAFFWNAHTEMNCLKQVIHRALSQGYTHHIERLMVLCNFCLLAGISPQAVNDWFTACYLDAYEWVMLPNVLGMGLYADGGVTATKPYIASANYIHKMSDYCAKCIYHPSERLGENACPFNFLYWNFLIQHEKILRSNPRMGPNVLGLGRISQEERSLIQRQAGGWLQELGRVASSTLKGDLSPGK